MKAKLVWVWVNYDRIYFCNYYFSTIPLTYSSRRKEKIKSNKHFQTVYFTCIAQFSIFPLSFFFLIFAFILWSFLCCAEVCLQWELERGHMPLCIDWCCSCRQCPVNQKCLEENFKLSPFIKINSVLLNFSNSLQSHETLLQNLYNFFLNSALFTLIYEIEVVIGFSSLLWCISEWNGFLNKKKRVGHDFVHQVLIRMLLFSNCCDFIWVTGLSCPRASKMSSEKRSHRKR